MKTIAIKQTESLYLKAEWDYRVLILQKTGIKPYIKLSIFCILGNESVYVKGNSVFT